MMADETTFLTVSEAARRLRVSRPTVWRWVDSGRLRAYRVAGRTIRIRAEDLDALVRPVKHERDADAQMLVFEHGDAIVGPDELTRRIAQLHQRILTRRAGKLLPSSVGAIRNARQERTRQL